MNILRLKIYCSYFFTKPLNLNFESNKPKIYIFLAADYGNLGDIAITYAQQSYLQNKFINHEIIEIPISQTAAGLKTVKRIINPNDIITIIGGGNMGDLYDDIEFLRQLIIKNFPNNKIISFPQTIDFSNTKFGIKSLNIAKRIYSKHKDLTIIAREEKSYQFLIRHFSENNLIKTPDIVFTLNYEKNYIRDSIILCLRNDKEKTNSSEITSLINCIDKKKEKIKYYDTHVGDIKINSNDRIKYLTDIWDAFASSKLIITDRLHGMIFAYITRTPAIVFDNTNNKISQCYEWIKDCGFIYLYNPNINIMDLHHSYNDVQSHLNNEIDKIYCYLK